MSLVQVQKALENFGTAPEDRAIVFKGAWGTGKTFLWDLVVKQKKSYFSKPQYSYVSLFGINSLGEFKRAIFENSIDKNFADEAPSLKTLITNFKALRSNTNSLFKRFFRFGAEISIPYVKGVGSLIESVQYASVRDITICIDDFERKGAALTDRDVLGLVSNLIDKKRCRVILILNEKTLKPDAEFFSFSEKVFDYEVAFNPSVDEAIGLVFKSGSETEKRLIHNLKALRINNIRLLKKVDFFLSILKPYFDKWQVEVETQALHILPLAVLAIYGGKDTLADIEVIRSLEKLQVEFSDVKSEINSEKETARSLLNKKIGFLSDYGFGSCDDFDLAIISLVNQGYPDEENILKITDAFHKKVRYDRNFAVLKSAWALFRGSYELNEVDVFNHFEHALAVTLPDISIRDLDHIAFVYMAIDKETIFQKHVDEYFKLAEGRGFLNYEENLGKPPECQYIVDLLNKYLLDNKVGKSLYDIFENWPDMIFMEIDSIHTLSLATVDDFYYYFKMSRGEESFDLVGKCLRLGAVSNAGYELRAYYNKIMISSYEAVLKIASESKLNEYRLQKLTREYGDGYKMAKKDLSNPSASAL
jgi:hypothetical protein